MNRQVLIRVADFIFQKSFYKFQHQQSDTQQTDTLSVSRHAEYEMSIISIFISMEYVQQRKPADSGLSIHAKSVRFVRREMHGCHGK